ncbi:MAG: hypothetical protein LC798_15355 [Chloroflexi bacterium]|nr:hypothetical protein [Chloroflexota bacterium]
MFIILGVACLLAFLIVLACVMAAGTGAEHEETFEPLDDHDYVVADFFERFHSRPKASDGVGERSREADKIRP